MRTKNNDCFKTDNDSGLFTKIKGFQTALIAFLFFAIGLTAMYPEKNVQAHGGYPNKVKVTSKYKYDGKPHILEIPDISESCIVKYGKKKGKYNLKKSPTRTKPGKTTVYFKVKDRKGKLLFTGKGRIVIKGPVLSKTIITDQQGENGLTVDEIETKVLQ